MPICMYIRMIHVYAYFYVYLKHVYSMPIYVYVCMFIHMFMPSVRPLSFNILIFFEKNTVGC